MKDRVNAHLLRVQPYQPGKPASEVQREMGIAGVLKLASNENLLGPSPLAVNALRENSVKMNFYPDGGCYYLRRRIAEKFSVPPSNVAIGSGTDEIIRILCQIFLRPGTQAVMGHPSFVMYLISPLVAGADVVQVPLRDHTLDLDAMLDKVSDSTRIVFISNPNNPTGTIVTKAETESFLAKLPPDVLAVFDEAYFEYVNDPRSPDAMEYFRPDGNVAVLRTFSKVHGLAGLRVGYGFLPDAAADAFDRVRNPFNVNQAAQEAALAALGDLDHVRKSVEFNRRGKLALCRGLDRLGVGYIPTHANFILVNVRADSEEIFKKLLLRGIIVRPGRFLGYPTHVRVTIPSESDCPRFIDALEEALAER
ncbi:MAG: histidinol-phosphate transaminase [bacterium]